MASTSITTSGSNYIVAVEGLADADFGDNGDRIKEWASMAINATARKYRTEGSKAIRKEVAFPADYLDSSTDGRLKIDRFAAPGSLAAVVQGRFDATSLARFVRPGQRFAGKKSPTVEVQPGHAVQMKRAFIMSLNNGNLGLAIRLKPGEKVENKTKMVQVKGNLYLLYGPSVDQVFRSVAGNMAGPAGDYFEREFMRLSESLK